MGPPTLGNSHGIAVRPQGAGFGLPPHSWLYSSLLPTVGYVFNIFNGADDLFEDVVYIGHISALLRGATSG